MNYRSALKCLRVFNASLKQSCSRRSFRTEVRSLSNIRWNLSPFPSPVRTAQSNYEFCSNASADDAKKQPKPRGDPVTVTFVLEDGTRHTVQGRVGDSLLDVVIDKQVPLDGYGACEGTLACSTCHVVLKKADYDRLPDKPCDEELDMLDLAFGLTDTSRLGCQIILSKDLDGLEVVVPSGVYDARSN